MKQNPCLKRSQTWQFPKILVLTDHASPFANLLLVEIRGRSGDVQIIRFEKGSEITDQGWWGK